MRALAFCLLALTACSASPFPGEARAIELLRAAFNAPEFEPAPVEWIATDRCLPAPEGAPCSAGYFFRSGYYIKLAITPAMTRLSTTAFLHEELHALEWDVYGVEDPDHQGERWSTLPDLTASLLREGH